MHRALRRYTEYINYRDKLNEEHPSWNFVDVIKLTEELVSFITDITQQHVAFFAMHMTSDLSVKECTKMVTRCKNEGCSDEEEEKAAAAVFNSIFTYWKIALQLTEEECEKIKPQLTNTAYAWVE